MEDKLIPLIIIVAAALIFIMWVAVYFSEGRRKGRAAEKKVAKYIKKIGKGDNIKVINNAYLPLYNKACEIDHLVFGKFGVLVVETKGISGTVSGDGKKLIHTVGSQRHKLYNPQLQNQTHIDNVIHHLKKGGFNKVPVYGAVVFTDKDIDLKTDVGMRLDDFKKFYNSLRSSGCNQDILYGYFSGLQVKNPFKKVWIKTRKKDD